MTDELHGLDVIFLATPAEVSLELVPQIMLASPDLHIIDLSGAYRLPAADFERWYRHTHTHERAIDDASYGLVPWQMDYDTDLGGRLIANPGCFATCAQMALLPLLKANLILSKGIIIDAKSGLTGAGRKPSTRLQFCEMADDFYPYKIGEHQHTPEIKHYLKLFSGETCDITLTTHVLPIRRGISMTIYADLASSKLMRILVDDTSIDQTIHEVFEAAYADYRLVRYGALNTMDAASQRQLLSLNHVQGSARVHIAWQRVGQKLLIVATLDNLLKEAASQAVENFNALYALPYDQGLSTLEGLL
jgi:N-acetyl-gamma-glutamyl-phosphate reductase